MFERFTDRARRVVVRAQEEARGLHHNFIGTEHLLLALLDERDGLAAQALDRFQMKPDPVREEVRKLVGPGAEPPKGHIPFTPRAKKVLELALREALELHHNYIGTEHILLGVIREGDGVGAQILREHAADLLPVRMAVLDLLKGFGAQPRTRGLRSWLRPSRRGGTEGEEHAGQHPEPSGTPAAQASLAEAARLAENQPVGSHHLMLAALSDPKAAAAQALSKLGIDLAQVRHALSGADVTGTTDELPEEAGRRQMVIRVESGTLTLEATDQVIVDLGLAALADLGDEADPPGTIRGSLPASASLSDLWLELRDSLQDISRRAVMRSGQLAAGAQAAASGHAAEASAQAAGASAQAAGASAQAGDDDSDPADKP